VVRGGGGKTEKKIGSVRKGRGRMKGKKSYWDKTKRKKRKTSFWYTEPGGERGKFKKTGRSVLPKG